MVLDFLAIDNFDFMRKIVKKILGEKLVKMLGFCQNWIFGQNLTFQIVCNNAHCTKLTILVDLVNNIGKVENWIYSLKSGF